MIPCHIGVAGKEFGMQMSLGMMGDGRWEIGGCEAWGLGFGSIDWINHSENAGLTGSLA